MSEHYQSGMDGRAVSVIVNAAFMGGSIAAGWALPSVGLIAALIAANTALIGSTVFVYCWSSSRSRVDQPRATPEPQPERRRRRPAPRHDDDDNVIWMQ